jgi:hypothetical protein
MKTRYPFVYTTEHQVNVLNYVVLSWRPRTCGAQKHIKKSKSKGKVKSRVKTSSSSVSKGRKGAPMKDTTSPRQLREHNGRKSYAVDGGDGEYFKMPKNEMVDERGLRQHQRRRSKANYPRIPDEGQRYSMIISS